MLFSRPLYSSEDPRIRNDQVNGLKPYILLWLAAAAAFKEPIVGQRARASNVLSMSICESPNKIEEAVYGEAFMNLKHEWNQRHPNGQKPHL